MCNSFKIPPILKYSDVSVKLLTGTVILIGSTKNILIMSTRPKTMSLLRGPHFVG